MPFLRSNGVGPENLREEHIASWARQEIPETTKDNNHVNALDTVLYVWGYQQRGAKGRVRPT